jgi:hypothetical protein
MELIVLVAKGMTCWNKEEKIKDAKGVMKSSHYSKKDRQYNYQKKKNKMANYCMNWYIEE